MGLLLPRLEGTTPAHPGTGGRCCGDSSDGDEGGQGRPEGSPRRAWPRRGWDVRPCVGCRAPHTPGRGLRQAAGRGAQHPAEGPATTGTPSPAPPHTHTPPAMLQARQQGRGSRTPPPPAPDPQKGLGGGCCEWIKDARVDPRREWGEGGPPPLQAPQPPFPPRVLPPRQAHRPARWPRPRRGPARPRVPPPSPRRGTGNGPRASAGPALFGGRGADAPARAQHPPASPHTHTAPPAVSSSPPLPLHRLPQLLLSRRFRAMAGLGGCPGRGGCGRFRTRSEPRCVWRGCRGGAGRAGEPAAAAAASPPAATAWHGTARHGGPWGTRPRASTLGAPTRGAPGVDTRGSGAGRSGGTPG